MDNLKKINWFPGHMKKALKQMEERVKLVDYIIEVIDSRLPVSSKNFVLENFKQSHNLKRIIIFSKTDMCDLSQLAKWTRYYEERDIIVIPYDLKKENKFSKLFKILGEEQTRLFEKYKAKGLTNYKIKAMVIGVPNVGKSTFINKIAKRRAASVANTPGHTKAQQWINVNEKVQLLDTPGVMPTNFKHQEHAYNLAILGSIKKEILNLDDIVFYALRLLHKHYPKALDSKYGISLEGTEVDDIVAFLEALCAKRHYKQGKYPDHDRAMNVVLNDLINGELGRVTLDWKV